MSQKFSFSGPIHWALDWDGTLTRRDTLDALVAIAAKRKPDFPVGKEWERVTQAYMDDYKNVVNWYSPKGGLTPLAGEKALLNVLEQVEQRSINRVSESRIFQGLTTHDLDKGAAEAVQSEAVALRGGCNNFLHLIGSSSQHGNNNENAISIISVNWSRRFILECLKAVNADFAEMLSTSIYANELEGIAQGTSATGRICADDAQIISSAGKLYQLLYLKKYTLRQGKEIPVVYIGDSLTDIECLLSADLGICMRDDPMTTTQSKLAEALERVGISCVPLREMKGPRSVVWISSFHDLLDQIGNNR